MVDVTVLPNDESRKCQHRVVYADNGPATCLRHGRVMVGREVYCLQHAGAVAIQHAIDRGTL